MLNLPKRRFPFITAAHLEILDLYSRHSYPQIMTLAGMEVPSNNDTENDLTKLMEVTGASA